MRLGEGVLHVGEEGMGTGEPSAMGEEGDVSLVIV